MSVIIFPRRHAGERQPGVGVIHLPGNLASISRSLVLSGLDASTAAAVEAEFDVFGRGNQRGEQELRQDRRASAAFHGGGRTMMLQRSPAAGELLTRLKAPDPNALAVPSSYNPDAHTIEAAVATGYPVKRGGFTEILVISADAVDLTRAAAGRMAFLFNHDQDQPIGTVVKVWIKSGKLFAKLRFADTAEGRKAEGQVARGELSQFSVGYNVHEWASSGAGRAERAVSWELFEVSLAPVPADPGAIVRSIPNPSRGPKLMPRPLNTEDDENDDTLTVDPPPQNPPTAAARSAERAERTRVRTITDIARRGGMEQQLVDEAVENGTTVQQFRERAWEVLMARQAPPISNVRVERDEGETRMRDYGQELMRRMAGEQAPRDATSSRFFGLSLVEMAAESIGHRGRIPMFEAGREDILKRAFHATSDFPNMFEGALRGRLHERYQTAQPTYRQLCLRRDLADFRQAPHYRPADFPSLQPVNPEAGEIKFGTFSDLNRELLSVSSWAVILAFSRAMLINDNLRAIDDMIGSYATSVHAQEESVFWKLVLKASGAGPTLLSTSRPIFNVTDGSLAAAAAAINAASVGLGRAAMRKQKTTDGLFIQSEPRFLVVGPDKETEADQLLATITPQQTSQVNPFAGKLEKIVTPEITGNAWYLFADPARVPAFAWSLLEGYPAPRLSFETPFTSQGLQAKVEHDVGFTAIDFRGAYRNPGA